MAGNFPAMCDFHDMPLNRRKGIFISLIALIILPGCHSTILRVIEGKSVRLDFTYPCNSTEVTLQHGNGRPFYRSANPQYTSLSSNQGVTNHIDSESDQCFLSLTINPVSRNDEGTFILMAYKDGVMLPDYSRIGLRVNYPPGKASCEIGDKYTYNEGWVSLRCTAQKGTFQGRILCYQNDITLPQANNPTESGQTLIQSVFANLHVTHLIHCCSSTISHMTEKCECKDWGWDPIQGIALHDIVDPCPRVMSTQGITSSFAFTTDTVNSSLISNQPTAITKEFPMQEHWYIWLLTFFLVISMLAVIALSIAYYVKARQAKPQDPTTSNGTQCNKQKREEEKTMLSKSP